MGLPDLAHRHQARANLRHHAEPFLGGLRHVGDLRHLDFLQVLPIADLDFEMPGDDVVSLVGLRQVHILDDAEVGAVDGQRAFDEIAHHHVRGQVPPLIERLPQGGFPLAGPRVLGAQRQLVVDVHLVPRDLVDPDHRAGGFQIVEPAPEFGLFPVDRQRGDLGEFGDEAAQHFLFRRLEVDGGGGDRLGAVAGIVEHGCAWGYQLSG